MGGVAAFFAAGKVLQISQDLDLTEVALSMSTDDADKIKKQIDAGEISLVADDKVKELFEAGASVWSVVVKPYVLIQEIVE